MRRPSRPPFTLTPAKALTRAWLLLLLAGAPTFASKAAEPALGQLRPYQVWLDELPPTLAAADVEIVVLQPDARCKPVPVKALGFLSVQLITPIDKAYCQRLQSFVERPQAPLPLATRLHTTELSSRQPAAIVAALQPAPQRRYVALVYWQAVEGQPWQWAFEEAVIDRDSGRWVWHAARGHGTMTLRDLAEKSELQALASVLQHELPRDLLDRGWWRRHVPLDGSRWVPPADIPGWMPAPGRAGLAIVNSYTDNPRMDSYRTIALWPQGAAEVPAQRVEPATWRTVQRPQFAPILPTGTHALLDLPAGPHQMRVYGDAQPLLLEPGRVTVLHIQRSTLSNATTTGLESAEWWQARIAPTGTSRHAFLAEPPARGSPGLVPFFQP
jgi:hypothetical protein